MRFPRIRLVEQTEQKIRRFGSVLKKEENEWLKQWDSSTNKGAE